MYMIIFLKSITKFLNQTVFIIVCRLVIFSFNYILIRLLDNEEFIFLEKVHIQRRLDKVFIRAWLIIIARMNILQSYTALNDLQIAFNLFTFH